MLREFYETPPHGNKKCGHADAASDMPVQCQSGASISSRKNISSSSIFNTLPDFYETPPHGNKKCGHADCASDMPVPCLSPAPIVDELCRCNVPAPRYGAQLYQFGQHFQ